MCIRDRMLSTPACNQHDDATIRTFLADVDIHGRYTGQGAPPTRRYVIELSMRGSSLGVWARTYNEEPMFGILLHADHPWANVLEQAVKNWWYDRSGTHWDGNGQHAGHDPAVLGFAGVLTTLIDSQWPPYNYCDNVFFRCGRSWLERSPDGVG